MIFRRDARFSSFLLSPSLNKFIAIVIITKRQEMYKLNLEFLYGIIFRVVKAVGLSRPNRYFAIFEMSCFCLED